MKSAANGWVADVKMQIVSAVMNSVRDTQLQLRFFFPSFISSFKWFYYIYEPLLIAIISVLKWCWALCARRNEIESHCMLWHVSPCVGRQPKGHHGRCKWIRAIACTLHMWSLRNARDGRAPHTRDATFVRAGTLNALRRRAAAMSQWSNEAHWTSATAIRFIRLYFRSTLLFRVQCSRILAVGAAATRAMCNSRDEWWSGQNAIQQPTSTLPSFRRCLLLVQTMWGAFCVSSFPSTSHRRRRKGKSAPVSATYSFLAFENKNRAANDAHREHCKTHHRKKKVSFFMTCYFLAYPKWHEEAHVCLDERQYWPIINFNVIYCPRFAKAADRVCQWNPATWNWVQLLNRELCNLLGTQSMNNRSISLLWVSY